MQSVPAKGRDTDQRERIADECEESSGAELVQRISKIDLKASCEKDQDQRQRAESVRHLAVFRGIHPAQHRIERDARDQQNDHVWHTRPLGVAVGHERQYEQRAQKTKEWP